MRVFGVILAGGRGSRMGGADKPLLPLAGRSLLAHCIGRLEPQVASLAISANGDPARFAAFGLPVLADHGGESVGPLAGLLAGMDWAAAQGADVLVSVAVDTPFFPCDLVPRLQLAAGAEGGALAASSGRQHPVFGLWPVAARHDLRAALAQGLRRVTDWAGRQGSARPGVADFAASDPDPFFNINTPDDLARAAMVLGARVSAKDGGSSTGRLAAAAGKVPP